MQKIANFVGGKLVDARDGATTPLVDPCTGTEYGTTSRVRRGRRRRHGIGRGERRVRRLAHAHAVDHGRALLPSPTRSKTTAARFIDAESASTGKPKALIASTKFRRPSTRSVALRAQARMLEGKGAGEVHERAHARSSGASRSACRAQVSPWNYPLMMAVWKIAPTLEAGHGRAEARGDHAGDRGDARRAGRRFLPPRRARCRVRRSRLGSCPLAHPGRPASCPSPGACAPGWRWPRRPRPTKRVHLELGGNARRSCATTPTWQPPQPGSPVPRCYNAGQDCTAGDTRGSRRRACYDELRPSLVEAAGRR